MYMTKKPWSQISRKYRNMTIFFNHKKKKSILWTFYYKYIMYKIWI